LLLHAIVHPADIQDRDGGTLLLATLFGMYSSERTLAWLNRCRRHAKDWENVNRKALAFLRLASIRLMLRKLCNPVLSKAPQLLR
jgi:hypothetical protein